MTDDKKVMGGQSAFLVEPNRGLTKLEWFAGMALSGAMANRQWDSSAAEDVADWCWVMADAMIARHPDLHDPQT